MELHTAGENALILYLGKETSPATAARVQAACAAIEAALRDEERGRRHFQGYRVRAEQI